MSISKKLQTIAVLIIVLSISIQVPFTLSEETVDTSEVLYFLKDVANIDVSKYEPKLVTTTSENPPELGGISQITGQYDLESEESTINVLFKFRNNTLCYCSITVVEGETHQVEDLPADISDHADGFLQRYQAYTADSTIDAMRSTLDTVDVTENGVKVEGNIKLEVTVDPLLTSLSWKNTFNGADYTSLSLSFENGTFAAFRDDRSYFKIGSTDVNLSKEDAVDLALLHATDLSWELLNGTKVMDFTIVEDKIGAALLTQPREPLMLHPYWLVILPLDKMYPGFITQIMFQVWADTGEVITCTPLGQGGEVPTDVSYPTQQDDEPLPLMDSLLFIVVVTAAIVVVVAILAFKKKQKKHWVSISLDLRRWR